MRVFCWILCFTALASGALGANSGEPQPVAPPKAVYPNVLLITLDTTRADRMGFLGSKRGLTPHLDALARDSAVFTHAYSQAPLTPTSHATILSGTYPQYHQVLTFPIPLGKTIPYLPAILKGHGYATAAYVGSLALAPSWGAPGFDRGFDVYDANFSWQGYTPQTRYQTVERRGGVVVAQALSWLGKHQQGPFFLWVHLFDAHEPYDPPQPYKTRYAKAPYDGEIAYADSCVGKLLAQLKAAGLYDGMAIALTADHGESLGAHGEDQHGIFLYDETIHVPLLIKLPNGQSAGARVETAVELADIMPTLLQTTGIEVPQQVQGASLLELMKPGPEGAAAASSWRDRGAYSEADYGHVTFGWSAEQSLRAGKYLYIQAPRRELYDRLADPAAARNLASAAPAVADTLEGKVKDIQQRMTNTGETPKSVMDEARMKKLAALGYLGARSEAAIAPPSELDADPKDKVGVANMINRVNNALQDFRCAKAKPIIEEAIKSYPNISMFHFFKGGCYLEEENYEKAAPELRAAVRLDPGFVKAELNLGRALLKTNDLEGAAIAFEHVSALEPHILDAYSSLMTIYYRLGRFPDAIKECRRVLQTVPDNFEANFLLGESLVRLGDREGAIAPLRKAAEVQPDRPGPHIVLGGVYAKLGREEDATRENAEAERLGVVRKSPLNPEQEQEPEPK